MKNLPRYTKYHILYTSAFTLIELLVVISIIGILAVLISANLNSARSRARDAQRKSDIRSIATALRLYFNDWNVYPPTVVSASHGFIGGCTASPKGSQPVGICNWGDAWTDGFTTTYMGHLPKDPLSNQIYFYKGQVGGATDQYLISACLENGSDASGVAVTQNGSNGYTDKNVCPSQWVFVIQP